MTRLALFELHHLGDATMALPFLRGAAERYEVTVICRPEVAAYLRAAAPNVKTFAAAESWFGRFRTAGTLNLGKEDFAASVWPDARVHILMARSGAGTRAGMPATRGNFYAPDIPWRQRRLFAGRCLTVLAERIAGRPLLTTEIHRESPEQSHMLSWERLAGALRCVPNYKVPWLPPGAPLPADIAAFLRAHSGRKILLVHPGGRLPTKRWPYFGALLDRLSGQSDLAVLIIKPPGEDAPAPRGVHQQTVEVSDWPTLFGVFHRADAVICNDSLASHLAAAAGKPVVTVFGSGNPAWFAPWNNLNLVAASDVCPHRPCIDRCVMPSPICLESVSVGLVESRLRRVWNAG